MKLKIYMLMIYMRKICITHKSQGVFPLAFYFPLIDNCSLYFLTSSNITFSGTIIGKLPTFEANKKYEFDVLANTWIVQEIVSQS